MDRRLIFIAALIAGSSFYLNHWLQLEGTPAIVWKGAGVALLAIWARVMAESLDGKLIAAALALGALGDVLLEIHEPNMIPGAIAFLAGHLTASILYFRSRRGPIWQAVLVAVAVAAAAWSLPTDRSAAPGIAVYALSLGVMAGTASISRFPQKFVGAGALLFIVSDLLIFARMGPLATSALPGLLIWPTYFAAQALIAWGVVTVLAREAK